MKNIFAFLVLLSIVSSCRESLDSLGIKYGTDKSSLFHAYTHIYEKYFEQLREKSLKFLEIGFSRGSSAHMWEEYFCNAQLFFIDNDPNISQFIKKF